MNCSDCTNTYTAYLCDIPTKWREQIVSLLCRALEDITSAEAGCDKVKNCETLTVLNPVTFDGETLSIPYRDENGVTTTRTVDMTSLTGDFIEDQFVGAQTAEFWINGRSRVGNIDVTGATLPTNGLNLPATNTLGFVAGGAQVTTIELVDGLMTHSGNIFLDAAISAEPGISFFLNTLSGNDYFIQRRGTTIDLHGAGIVELSVGGGGGSGRAFTVNANVNQGHEWYSMDVTDQNIMQLFPDGSLLLMSTNVQQTPDTGAILKVVSTTRGVVFPNMTTAQKMAISPPSPGMVVYDTDLDKLCVYTSLWETITSA